MRRFLLAADPLAVRIGIVGAGAIVQQMHIPVLRCLGSASISWITDADAARALKVARANRIPRAGSAADDLASLPPVDVILLAVPWGARHYYYEQVRGLPTRPALYVEKPFARSSAQHREIVSGFTDWQVAIGHSRRVGGAIQFARHLTASGVMGPARKCEVSFGGLGRILTRGGYYGDLSLAGGGILMEMGTHYLDAALEVLDARSMRLETRRIIDHAGFDVHVEGTLRVQTASGLDLPLVCRFSYLESLVSECVVSFAHGKMAFGIDSPDSFSITGHNGQRLPFRIDQSFGPDGMQGMMAVFWQEFLDSVASASAGRANACEMTLVSRAVGLLYGEET
jgi:predicted dehydrogenase